MNWINIPEAKFKEWRRPFEESKEGINVSGTCGICGAARLHRYFGRPHPHASPEFFPGTLGRAGLWEWCSGCYTYGHYSATVPDWWTCSLVIDERLLTPEPTLLEAALQGADASENQGAEQVGGGKRDQPPNHSPVSPP